jgi:hypothetical protein
VARKLIIASFMILSLARSYPRRMHRRRASMQKGINGGSMRCFMKSIRGVFQTAMTTVSAISTAYLDNRKMGNRRSATSQNLVAHSCTRCN